MNKKGTAGIGIILAMLIFGACGFFGGKSRKAYESSQPVVPVVAVVEVK